MIRIRISCAVAASLAAVTFAAAPALANDKKASKDEAVAMVKKGVQFIKDKGADAGYAEITKADSAFHDGDLYLVVYGLDGTVHAHGANPKMVGKNLIGLKDVDGKEFVKERVELGKSKGTFWQEYKFTNPVTKKIEPKVMYCEKQAEIVVCGGVYK